MLVGDMQYSRDADGQAAVHADADEDILRISLFGDIGPKQTPGYDMNTSIAYAGLVLGSPVCAGRIRDILDAIEWAQTSRSLSASTCTYKKIRICAAPHLAVPVLLAAFISEWPVEVDAGLHAADFEELFTSFPASTKVRSSASTLASVPKNTAQMGIVNELDILPGLLQIGDMSDFIDAAAGTAPMGTMPAGR